MKSPSSAHPSMHQLMQEITEDLHLAETALFRSKQTTNRLCKMLTQLEMENINLREINKDAVEVQQNFAICLTLLCLLILCYIGKSLVECVVNLICI